MLQEQLKRVSYDDETDARQIISRIQLQLFQEPENLRKDEPTLDIDGCTTERNSDIEEHNQNLKTPENEADANLERESTEVLKVGLLSQNYSMGQVDTFGRAASIKDGYASRQESIERVLNSRQNRSPFFREKSFKGSSSSSANYERCSAEEANEEYMTLPERVTSMLTGRNRGIDSKKKIS